MVSERDATLSSPPIIFLVATASFHSEQNQNKIRNQLRNKKLINKKSSHLAQNQVMCSTINMADASRYYHIPRLSYQFIHKEIKTKEKHEQ